MTISFFCSIQPDIKTTIRARSINTIFVLIFTDKFSLKLEAISFQPAAIPLTFEVKPVQGLEQVNITMLSLLNKQHG